MPRTRAKRDHGEPLALSDAALSLYVGQEVRLLKSVQNYEKEAFAQGSIMRVRAVHKRRLILQRTNGKSGQCNVDPRDVQLIGG